ncbi:MAG: glycosyltransferase family 39 protein [Acidobacteriota bacterium]
MAIALAGILCFVTGFLVVALGLGARLCSRSGLLLRISLSAGFGLAVFSIIYFLARWSGFLHLWAIDAALCAILLIILALVRKHRASSAPQLRASGQATSKCLLIAFAVAFPAALYSGVLRALARPYGSGWDSFAIWNLHARFLFRGGINWRDGFSPLIPWSHPDYPLLLPAAIAHFWTVMGRESTAVPAVIGLVFTFSTVGLLFSGLDILLSRTSALLGAMCLVSTPFFIDLGTWQYADVPLSFFMLATFVLLHLHDASTEPGLESRSSLALAGLAAGFAAWTKNEGVLFLVAVLLAKMWLTSRRSSPGRSPISQIAPMLLAVAPIFALIAFFKRAIAPPGDLFSDPATMLHKLGDLSRYGAVLKWYGRELLRFGEWWLIPLPIVMLVLYFLLRGNLAREKETILASAGALTLTLAGYFFIYLITPRDIYWHLRFSLNRLFLQLWPSTIFVFFLALGSKPFPTSVGDPEPSAP